MTCSRLSSDSIEGFTFFISPHGQGCRLSVEPLAPVMVQIVPLVSMAVYLYEGRE